MKKLLISAVAVALLAGCGNQVVEDKNFTKLTIYKNRDQEGPYVITDRKVIAAFIQEINSSPKEDLSKIVFEHGPDGRVLFEGKDSLYEMKIFSSGGDVVTDEYLIKTEFDLDELIEDN